MTTISQELAAAAESLASVGVQTPRLDAELLLAHVLDIDRAQLVIRARERADADTRTGYLALLTRRVRREPVAYILGRRAFRQLTLAVDPRVLIPRPETELLVEVGLTLGAGVSVADVGTGSGAVALALKQERPDLEVVGADSSAGALAVARMNAARLRLDVQWLQGDLLAGADCDAVLANLPYVAEDELLQPEVAFYEPTRALLGGADGLDVIRRMIPAAAAVGRVRVLALEVGAGQAGKVRALVLAGGFTQVEVIPDLAGIPRVVVARR